MGFFSKDKKPDEDEEPMIFDQDIVDPDIERRRIDQIRNKSGLLPQHQRMLQDEVPYDTAQSWVHTTLKYQRKIYGKYGAKSNLDPSKWIAMLAAECTNAHQILHWFFL